MEEHHWAYTILLMKKCTTRILSYKIFQSLQGKYLLVEVIVEVSSVTKLEKIVKKTSATTSVFDSGCF
jgi:ribosomal protein S6